MQGVYSVQFAAVAITAAQDLFSITPADDRPCEILGCYIGQYSDFGDAQDELLSIQIISGFTVLGSGGSAPTPQKVDTRSAAASFTAHTNDTTVANTGTSSVKHAEAFNVRAGWIYIPPPEMRIKVDQGDTTLVVRITAPADSLTTNGTLYVREY